jgi:hypothetical protein
MTAITATMHRSTFLRCVLLIDAATCAAIGALLTLDGGALAPLFGLAAVLLRCSGISLLPIAAFMVWVATRERLPRAGVWVVIMGNAGWVAGSAALLLAVAATPIGGAFVVAQALGTAVLAALEYVGLRHAAD